MLKFWYSTLIFVDLIGFFVHQAAACSPGNVADIAKIKSYLGSEVKPQALTTTGYSLKYAQGAEELSCNFEIPRSCKWQNAPADNVTDHNQFYLFEQAEEKVWWGYGILPGDSKLGNSPKPGNRFILAGDKESEAHGAVWYSNPIRCQKNTGTLKFSYWLYNQAKVDAVVLRPNIRPIEAIARPEQSCHKFQPLGTRCEVKIPPIDEPFQLAIRAYNLKGQLGSLAIIDDIEYEADICVDLFDFGPNFLMSPLESATRGDPVTKSYDIDCSSFDELCRWGNAIGNTLDWQSGRGPINPEKWTEYTQTVDTPFEPFAIIKTNGNRDVLAPRGRLISAPIPCQGNFGSITFRYWMSPNTQLRVCSVKTSNAEPIDCIQVDEFNSPGPRMIPIHGPIDEEFAIEFEALDFNGGAGGFVAVDDIEYKARFCSDSAPRAPRVKPPTPALKIESTGTRPSGGLRNLPEIDNSGPPPFTRPVAPPPTPPFAPVKPPPRPSRPPPPSIPTSAKEITRPRPTLPTPTQAELQACAVLSCDFEGNTMCGYRNEIQSAGDAQWNVFNTKLGSSGNVAVRKKATGYFLGATLDSRGQKAAIVSPTFQIDRTMKLSFNYNRGTFGSGIWVCRNRFDPTLNSPNCNQVAGPELTLDEWNGIAETSVDLLPSDSRVYIIATNNKSQSGRAAFSLDNIRLSFSLGGPIC